MKISVRGIVVAGALSAVAILLGATRLGFIPFVLGVAITIMHVPVIIGAVLEGPLVGTAIGLLFGIFSLIWAYVAPTGPGDLYFQNPLVSILPRLFIGLFAYLVYRALRRAGIPWVLLLAGLSLGLGAAFCYQWGQVNMPAALISAGVILGAVAAFTYLGVRQQPEMIAVAVAAIVGTLTNTVLVLGMIGGLSSLIQARPALPWSLLIGPASAAPVLSWEVIVGIGLANGIPEIIAAVLITVTVVAAWKQIEFGRKGARILHEG